MYHKSDEMKKKTILQIEHFLYFKLKYIKKNVLNISNMSKMRF